MQAFMPPQLIVNSWFAYGVNCSYHKQRQAG